MKKTLLLIGAALVFSACQSVPYTKRSHLILVSAAEEKKLGIDSYRQALAEAKLSSDSAATAMVRRVGQRLAQAAEKPDFEWEFNLLEASKTVNAWCLPGGKVAVYTGLLPVSRDEAGLAVVMGHEIAHALARHGAERMTQGLMAQYGGAALSVVLSDRSGAAQKMAMQAYGFGTNVGILLPFSRNQESEADHIGLILMAKAGYDPRAAIGFWERMAQATGGGGQGVMDRYLSTHPSNSDRINKIKSALPEAEKYSLAPKR